MFLTLEQLLSPYFMPLWRVSLRCAKTNWNFAKAFSSHEERFQAEMKRVQKWREALTKAANYSSWDLLNFPNGYYIVLIVKLSWAFSFSFLSVVCLPFFFFFFSVF
jgi:hypothetical protein